MHCERSQRFQHAQSESIESPESLRKKAPSLLDYKGESNDFSRVNLGEIHSIYPLCQQYDLRNLHYQTVLQSRLN